MNIQYKATLFRSSKGEFEKTDCILIDIPSRKLSVIEDIYNNKFKPNIKANKCISDKQFILFLETVYEPKSYSFYLIETGKSGKAKVVLNMSTSEKIKELTQ